MKNYALNEEQITGIYNHEEGFTTMEETMETIRTEEIIVAITRGEVETSFNGGEALSEGLYEHLYEADYQSLTEEVAALVEEYNASKAESEEVEVLVHTDGESVTICLPEEQVEDEEAVEVEVEETVA